MSRQRKNRISPAVAGLFDHFGESDLQTCVDYMGECIKETIRLGEETSRWRNKLMGIPDKRIVNTDTSTHNVVSMSIKGLESPRLDGLVPVLAEYVRDTNRYGG